MRVRMAILMMAMALALFMVGCTLTTTVIVEEGYDVRLVNRSGEKVRLRWDGGDYRYLDHDQVIYIPADSGCYELEWVGVPSRSRTRSVHIFSIEVDADIEIVFNEGPDVVIIDR
jgi:hypothetical protein